MSQPWKPPTSGPSGALSSKLAATGSGKLAAAGSGKQTTSSSSKQTSSSSSKTSSSSSSSKTSSSSRTLTTTTKQGISILFRNPNTPIFAAQRGAFAFSVPQSFLSNRFKEINSQVQKRFGGVENRIQLREITQPDLEFAEKLSRRGGFSLFNEKHKLIAGKLITIFMSYEDPDDFMSVAAFARDRLNPYLYQYALSVATAHRKDTREVEAPTIVQTFPDQFMDPGMFNRLRQEASLVESKDRKAIDIPPNFTASELEEEQRLAYFREDIGVNSHHWHWHLVYPGAGPESVVNKDRRGELFYYMHSQLIARYNSDRFAGRLKRVARLSNFRDIIPEGYFPKIIRSSNNRAYPPRISNARLLDLNRDGEVVEVADLERWRDRVYEAIDKGFALSPTGEQIPLTIDILGDIVEASQRNPNPALYGALHNQGHNIISYIHDPDARHLEEYAVMGDVATAMRDPIFYRWHAFVDSIFARYKNTLGPYNDQQLLFQGVKVDSVSIQMQGRNNPPQNTLLTFWQRSQVDLSAGLDFGPDGNVFAAFTHLQHAPFNYRIVVNNTGAKRRGTCRIFMAPKLDERGIALQFKEQRGLMIEMDKFSVNLTPGSNTILRRSDQSSVTIPFERTFRGVGVVNQPTGADALSQFQFCGCGWPDHMLVPHGTTEGMSFDLFVMISNYADDTTSQEAVEGACNDSESFCGVRDSLYPDKRDMGYPFDRTNSSQTLGAFIDKKPNMAVQEVSVRFSNTIVNRT